MKSVINFDIDWREWAFPLAGSIKREKNSISVTEYEIFIVLLFIQMEWTLTFDKNVTRGSSTLALSLIGVICIMASLVVLLADVPEDTAIMAIVIFKLLGFSLFIAGVILFRKLLMKKL